MRAQSVTEKKKDKGRGGLSSLGVMEGKGIQNIRKRSNISLTGNLTSLHQTRDGKGKERGKESQLKLCAFSSRRSVRDINKGVLARVALFVYHCTAFNPFFLAGQGKISDPLASTSQISVVGRFTRVRVHACAYRL